jgi:hypothetical protein
MTIIRNISWADDLGFASLPQARERRRRRDGTGDVIQAIVIGLTLGVSIWAVLIGIYFYFRTFIG